MGKNKQEIAEWMRERIQDLENKRDGFLIEDNQKSVIITGAKSTGYKEVFEFMRREGIIDRNEPIKFDPYKELKIKVYFNPENRVCIIVSNEKHIVITFNTEATETKSITLDFNLPIEVRRKGNAIRLYGLNDKENTYTKKLKWYDFQLYAGDDILEFVLEK